MIRSLFQNENTKKVRYDLMTLAAKEIGLECLNKKQLDDLEADQTTDCFFRRGFKKQNGNLKCTLYTYKAQTMCKTRFSSQGLILDSFKQKKNEEKNLMEL